MIISGAMLKLTHSFCRYTKLTCDIIYFSTTHSLLNCGRKILILYAQYSIVNRFSQPRQQLRLFASIRKKHRLKKPQNSLSEARETSQMDKYLLPSVAYVSRPGDTPPDNGGVVDFEPAFQPNPPRRRINQRRNWIPMNFRTWEQVSSKGKGSPFRFKVVSYNMLAQYLLDSHRYLYTQCEYLDLAWPVRFEKLFAEIMEVNPDIVCLQEVQSTHVKTFYVKFEERGYYGIFKPKTGHRRDGCAIYFKNDVFDLEEHMSVEYFQPELPLLNRDNIGLLMKLAPRECPTVPIVVATTHLLYNPRRNDVRLGQMQLLLAELDRFAYFEDDDGKETGYHPIVLTGDFNSLPESSVVRLLDMGTVCSIGRDRHDWRRIAVTDRCQHLAVLLNRPRGRSTDFSMLKIRNTEMMSCMTEPGPPEPPTRQETELDQGMMRRRHLFNSPIVQHPFCFASVYSRTKPNNTQETTTFQNSWVTVDYIYFSCCNKLSLLERLRLPCKEESPMLGYMPNDVYGSDHLMLAAHFEIRPNKLSF